AATIRDDLRRLAFGGDGGVHTSSPQVSMTGSQPGGAWASMGGPTPAGLPTRSTEFSTPGGTLITGPPGPAPLGLRMRALAIQWPRVARYGAAAAALLVLVLVYQCGRH